MSGRGAHSSGTHRGPSHTPSSPHTTRRNRLKTGMTGRSFFKQTIEVIYDSTFGSLPSKELLITAAQHKLNSVHVTINRKYNIMCVRLLYIVYFCYNLPNTSVCIYNMLQTTRYYKLDTRCVILLTMNSIGKE